MLFGCTACFLLDLVGNLLEGFLVKGLIFEPLHQKINNLHMRKQRIDQLYSNCTADQGLCVCSIDSLMHESEICFF